MKYNYIVSLLLILLLNGKAFAMTAPIPNKPVEDTSIEAHSDLQVKFLNEEAAKNQDQDNKIARAKINKDRKTPDLVFKTQKKAPIPPIAKEDNTQPEEKNTVFVKKIIVEGSELLTPEEIKSAISGYEGKELTIDQLKQAVNEINKIYLKYNVLTATAYLPKQDITDNIVKISVIEGRIGKVKINGNKNTRNFYIKGALKQKEGDIIYIPELKDEIVNFNKYSDIKLKATVKKGENLGESDLIIDAYDPNPYHISAGFDNLGRDTVGVLRGSVNFQDNSLFGIRDKLMAGYARNRSVNSVYAGYSVPIGYRGIRTGFLYSYGDAAVTSGSMKPLNIQGTSTNYTLYTTLPIITNQKYRVLTNLSLNSKTSRTDLDKDAGIDIPTTQVRSIVASLNGYYNDKYGQFSHSSDFSTGIPILGGKEKFFKYNGTLTRIQPLPKKCLLLLRAETQLTPNLLPAVEQYQLGGAYTVRGYTEGIVTGDNSYLFSSELRYPLFFLPEKIINYTLRDRLQGVLFAEMGQTFVMDTRNKRNVLVGLGMGLRFRLNNYMTGKVDYGFGITNRPDTLPNAKLHFGVDSSPF